MPSESERVAVKTPGEAAIVSRLLWWLAGCSGVIALVCATLAGLRFTHAGPLLSLLGAYLTILLTARVYSARRGVGDARLRLWIDVAASFTLTSLANLVLAYAAATVPAPDATAFVQRFDLAMGFHWYDYATTVSAIAPLSEALAFCYRYWMPQMLAAMTALAYVGDFAAIGEFAIGSTLTFLAIVAIFVCVDVRSLESVASYALPGFHHPSGAGPFYLHALEQLRSGADRTIDFNHVAGLISFPSLHGASALLLAAATRGLGPWRYPFLAFNVLVLVSTLSEGGPALTDVVAGALVACLSMAAATEIYRALSQRSVMGAQSVAAAPAA